MFSHVLQSRFKQLVLIAMFLPAMTSYGEDDQRLYRSSYYLGRGDTGLAIADDYEAMLYNPAGIAQGTGVYRRLILASPSLEFSDDARNMATELQAEDADIPSILKKRVGKNEHIGVYNLTALALRRASLGVFNAETTDILVFKSPASGGLEAVKARLVTSNGVVFAVAQDFLNQQLFVGANFKYLHRVEAALEASVVDADSLSNMKSSDLLRSGTGTSTDLGILYKIPGNLQPSLGMTINNVGATRFSRMNADSAAPRGLKQIINLGAAIQPGTKISKFRLLGEYWDATNQLNQTKFKKLHLGAELSVRDMIGVTGGFSGGGSSGGIYVNLYALRIDAGAYIQEVDNRVGVRPDKRLFFSITAGF
jgi:hypothetical protein